MARTSIPTAVARRFSRDDRCVVSSIEDVQGGDKVGHWSAGVMSVRAE